MGRRYHCDYCDRSFQDNLRSRKKHLNGVQHHRSKKAWYDLFRGASELLEEEEAKKSCRRFLRSGRCDFGPRCCFSHMSSREVDDLKARVEAEKRMKEEQSRQTLPCTIDRWLEERAKKMISRTEGTPEPPSYQLPPGWPSLHELPPSLHPPTPAEWNDQPDLEWG